MHFSVLLIDTNFSTLVILGRDGNKQLSPLGNKKTRLGARWSRVARDPLVLIGIFLPENLQVSLAREHVHSAAFRIVEKVVRFASDFAGCDLFACISIKDQELPC
jgi:hypothetical protein